MQINLNPTGLIPMAGGRATININPREIRIIATGLPEPKTIKDDLTVYQVLWFKEWVMGDRASVKLGVLRPGLDKTYFLNVLVSRETLREITGLVVTIVKSPSAISQPSDLAVLGADITQPLQD